MSAIRELTIFCEEHPEIRAHKRIGELLQAADNELEATITQNEAFRQANADHRAELAELRGNTYPGYKREKQIRIELERKVETLKIVSAQLRAILQEIDEKMANDNCYICEWCKNRYNGNHAPDCRLAALLEKEE